jgi:hypothetical protein
VRAGAPGRPDDDVRAALSRPSRGTCTPAADRSGASGSGRANGSPPTRRLVRRAAPVDSWLAAGAASARGPPPSEPARPEEHVRCRDRRPTVRSGGRAPPAARQAIASWHWRVRSRPDSSTALVETGIRVRVGLPPSKPCQSHVQGQPLDLHRVCSVRIL